MRAINAAIIGCGAIHICHVEALRQTPGAHLHAIVDTDIVKGQALATAYGCDFYHDYQEMLQDQRIEVVHICTPHYLHKTMILDALAAGKAVFSEKPVGMNSLEVADIAEAANHAPGMLGVCYQNRYNPTSRAIRDVLASNVLGKMLSIKAALTWSRSGGYYTESPWRGRFATEGGSLLINQAIHTLDLMQWFADGVDSVKGVVDSGPLAGTIETEDSAMATFALHNGARGLFWATNNHTADSPLLLEIHCEKGLLQLRDNTLWQISGNERISLANDNPPTGNGKNYWGIGHQKAIEHFYQAIQHGGDSDYININQAAKSIHIVEAIYRSSQLRQWINITH